MKGLRKYIAPFAPDQSGAAAVLCEMGGLVIILDAGGCTGNICGFDEPRWFGKKSAIYSAGLRDMDAILGRDAALVEKIAKACKKIEGQFVAVIGTPVPAVIATDYTALKKMIEAKTGLPAVTLNTDGTRLYDAGIEKTYAALFETFAGKDASSPERDGGVTAPAGFEKENDKNNLQKQEKKGILGILGATPMDVAAVPGEEDAAGAALKAYYQKEGWDEVLAYGMPDGLSSVKKAPRAARHQVIAPAGLPAAKYFQDTWGIPYEVGYPTELLPEETALFAAIDKEIQENRRRHILIVHQQVLANSLRDALRKRYACEVTVASWFMMKEELAEAGDRHITEEDEWADFVRECGCDLIVGDVLLKKALPDYDGGYVNLPHYAVSGKR